MPNPVTQALINNAVSNKYPGTLGSDNPYDMYNTQVQYNPSDITYFDNSVDAIRSGEAVGIDLPPPPQYTIPPTLPVNPLSQLMTTGALLSNALPGFKEDISQEWDAIRDWMPDKIEPQDFLPDAIRKGVPRALEGLGNLINVQAQGTGLDPPITKTEFYGRRSDDIRFPYPETGFFVDVDEQDYRAQVYEALSGMQTGNKELAELEEMSAISPGIRERLKGWATRDVWGDPMKEAEADYTYSFNDPATHAKILDNKVLSAISNVVPGIDVSWKNEDIASDLGAELGYGRSLTDAEYDALVHLTASAGQPHGGFSRGTVPFYEGVVDPVIENIKELSKFRTAEWDTDRLGFVREPTELEKFNIEGLTDFPDQAIQDALNNIIGNEYWQMSQSTGEPVDVKKMFLDPRVIRNLNMGADADPSAEDPKDRPSQIKALRDLIGRPEDDDYDAEKAADILKRYTTPGSQDLIDIATQVESFSAPPVEWTPPAPVTKAVTGTPPKTGARGIAASPGATKTALENADKARKESLRVEEQKEEQRQQDAADRASARESQRIASKASAAAKSAEKKKIAAEKKVQADFTAKVEKKKREDAAKAAKQMQEFMQWSAAEHKRHQEEQRLRELRGFGWGAMMT